MGCWKSDQGECLPREIIRTVAVVVVDGAASDRRLSWRLDAFVDTEFNDYGYVPEQSPLDLYALSAPARKRRMEKTPRASAITFDFPGRR